MSIDCYPYYELSTRLASAPERVGAGSLLYKNQESIWPEFAGKDLSTAHPGIQFSNFAKDGATTLDFLDGGYLVQLEDAVADPAIVTITLGGNDLLKVLGQDVQTIEKETYAIMQRMDTIIDLLTTKLPRATCILSTIYDPTDKTGILPGFREIQPQLKWLDTANAGIRECAKRNGTLLVDTYEHFQGHGESCCIFYRLLA